MQKHIRFVCVFLCVTLLFMSFFVPQAVAETTQGRITGDGVRVRTQANTSSAEITKLSLGTIVTINGETDGEKVDGEYGTKWYNVTYSGKTGYVYGKYIEVITPPAYNEDFESNLLNFPASYRDALRAIHNVYPNWVFVADNVGISLDYAIDLEYSESNMQSTRKWVELNYGIEWRDPRADADNPQHIKESRWTFASRRSIAFFMDPRNALTVTNSKGSFPNIFTFLEQSYNSATQTEAGLRSIISGTFLANGYDGDKDAYVKDIMSAAAQSGVSPYIIATTIITEQGTNGTSPLISGTYSGYEGYYNFFNYGAYGDNVIKNGLECAKEQGWNSRAKSILGGAKKYESGYLGAKQDTYYYMDFNVKYPSKIYHQYATNLYDQCIKAAGIRSAYTANKNAALTFKIPVYTSMPTAVYAAPTIDDYNADRKKLEEEQGEPDPPVEPEPEPDPPHKKGDVDGDGVITVKDFAKMRMHLLGVKKIDGDELIAADLDSDKELTVKDIARVRMFLLGIISI